MKNSLVARKPRNTTVAWLVGLTVFYFIAKTLSNR